jgi:hypothetical protein
VSAERLHALSDRLSERDQAIIQTINGFGFMTTRQLQTVHFAHHETAQAAARICRRVLQRLAEHRLVEAVDRRVGGLLAGSDVTIWRVGVVGDRWLRLSSSTPRTRFKQPSARFLDHRLMVAGCYTALIARTHAGQLELISAVAEPDSWRPYLGPGGTPDTLKPDLYAVTASGDFEDHWFIEIDRATESVPTVLKKCRQYERYRRTGREQQRLGLFPRVVWVVPDQQRADQLTRAISASSELDTALHRVTVMVDFVDLIVGGAA